MRYIQNISREQTRLLPYSVEEMVEETNPVRVIHAYVDSLLIRLSENREKEDEKKEVYRREKI